MAEVDSNQKDQEPEYFGAADDRDVLRFTWNARQEACEAKRERMLENRKNFDTFNRKSDYSHKKKGQSKEFLPKQRMAIQQLTAFISQSIIDAGQWFSIDEKPGMAKSEDLKRIKPDEAKRLLEWGLEKQGINGFIDDSIKLGLLGSLMINRITGVWKKANKYEVELETKSNGSVVKKLYKNSKDVWEPQFVLTRQEDFFPDPTGQNLFKIFQMEMDLYAVKKLAGGPKPLYRKEIVDHIVGGFEDLEQEARKARETNQLMTFSSSRKRVRIWECYGTILHPSTGDVIMENAMWTVCNDRYLIQPPIPNPFWHGEIPAVSAPIIRVPNSVWHTAVADAASELNLAMNELFNLGLDSGLMATWGIRQMRPGWMADDTKYADGIAPGDTIEVNEACPPGGKVLEPVQTSEMSPETLATYQQMTGEFNQSVMTNDLRMGTIPNKDIRATEVVEANQNIGSMLGGIAKTIESEYLVKNLKLLWMTIAQHIKDIDEEELISLFGKDRTTELLSMGAEEIFAQTVQGHRFKVFGISEALSKMKDFRKITALLQSVSGSEILMQEFIKKYDFGKLLGIIIRSLDIDTAELEHDQATQQAMMGQDSMAMGQGSSPNIQSQIPQLASKNMAESGNTAPQPAAMQNAKSYANAAQLLSAGK